MDDELWTAPQAADFFGLNRVYVSRLAKREYDKGGKWPIKRSHPYEAPLSEWQRILNQPDRVKRKPRKNTTKHKEVHFEEKIKDGISAAEAARLFGYSSSWASKLSRRSRRKGNQWPIWNGNRRRWLAPEKEWRRIFDDPELRAWLRKNDK